MVGQCTSRSSTSGPSRLGPALVAAVALGVIGLQPVGPASAVPPVCDPTQQDCDPGPSCLMRNTSPPTITGTVMVGETVTASPGAWTGAPQLAYRWLRDGNPITGATASTYRIPVPAGGRLSVQVTGTSPLCEDSLVVVSSAVAVAEGPAPVGTGVTIGGTPRVGHALTSTWGTWTGACPLQPGGSGVDLEWLDGGTRVGGGHHSLSDAAFTIPTSLVGHTLRSRVSATCPGYVTGFTTSAGVTVLPGLFSCGRPAYEGTAAVGHTLTVTDSGCRPAPTSVSYQWTRDGRPLADETGAGHTITPADAGHDLGVRIAVSADGYDDGTAGLDLGRIPMPPGPGGSGSVGTPSHHGSSHQAPSLVRQGARRPRVTGVARLHRTVRVSLRVAQIRAQFRPGGVRVRFQWFRGAHAIRHQTGRAHRVTAGDRGRRLRVRIRVRLPGYRTATLWTPWHRVHR